MPPCGHDAHVSVRLRVERWYAELERLMRELAQSFLPPWSVPQPPPCSFAHWDDARLGALGSDVSAWCAPAVAAIARQFPAPSLGTRQRGAPGPAPALCAAVERHLARYPEVEMETRAARTNDAALLGLLDICRELKAQRPEESAALASVAAYHDRDWTAERFDELELRARRLAQGTDPATEARVAALLGAVVRPRGWT